MTRVGTFLLTLLQQLDDSSASTVGVDWQAAVRATWVRVVRQHKVIMDPVATPTTDRDADEIVQALFDAMPSRCAAASAPPSTQWLHAVVSEVVGAVLHAVLCIAPPALEDVKWQIDADLTYIDTVSAAMGVETGSVTAGDGSVLSRVAVAIREGSPLGRCKELTTASPRRAAARHEL